MKRLAFLMLFSLSYFLASAQKVTSPEIRASFSLLELNRATVINRLALQDTAKIQLVPTIKLRQWNGVPTAFFCKMEDRVERSGKLPLRIRLGDLSYTNRMEGKN